MREWPVLQFSCDFPSASDGTRHLLLHITAIGTSAGFLVGAQHLLCALLCTLHSRDGYPGFRFVARTRAHPPFSECTSAHHQVRQIDP